MGNPARGLNLVGEGLHPAGRAPQPQRHQVSISVQRKMQRSDGQVGVGSDVRAQTLGGLAHPMVTCHGQCGYDLLIAPLQATRDEEVADHVSNGLGPVLISSSRDMAVKRRQKLRVERDTEAVNLRHRRVSLS